jgi:hypothetical protein
VLHVVRYKRKDIDQLIGQINASGYGLTLGVHTRIDETIAKVIDNVNAGNVYVNRNIVGAVVGVQPFGGEGLSVPARKPVVRCTCTACCRRVLPTRSNNPSPAGCDRTPDVRCAKP